MRNVTSSLAGAGSLAGFLRQLRAAFTAPGFRNAVAIIIGAICTVGARTVTGIIRAMPAVDRLRHHSVFHRFFSAARWCSDRLGTLVLEHVVLPLIPPGRVVLVVDDTLCRHTGPQIFGAGMHHDPLAGRTAFAFGSNFVVLGVHVPLAWTRSGVTLPVFFRLYRSKRTCPETEYRTRTQLALELLSTARAAIPAARPVTVVGDREYAVSTVVQGRPSGVNVAGMVHPRLWCFDTEFTPNTSGRPRVRGKKLAPPVQWADEKRLAWDEVAVRAYGKSLRMRVKSRLVFAPTLAGRAAVRVVLTRDPRGIWKDAVMATTDTSVTPADLVEQVALRWGLENAFRECKQRLAIESTQNGWGRRPKGKRRSRRQAGPSALGNKGQRAAERTVPFLMTIYTLVVVWFAQTADVGAELARAQALSPWDRQKRTITFSDMLSACRRELVAARLSSSPHKQWTREKALAALPEWIGLAS